MKTITHYDPPSTHELEALKGELNETGNGMATLAGLGGGNQWRKYTGGAKPRQVSVQLAFFIAARLELDEAQLQKVYTRMRAMGCGLELSEPMEAGSPA